MELHETIAWTKGQVERTSADLLKTFAAVPDDKLTWSPGGESRHALWLVAHVGASSEAFATFLRGETPEFPSDPQEMMAIIRNGGRDVKSREEAIRSVESSTATVLAALDTVTEERMASMTSTPFGPLPFSMWMDAAWSHAYGHARQLDYLQTIWGDIQDHR